MSNDGGSGGPHDGNLLGEEPQRCQEEETGPSEGTGASIVALEGPLGDEVEAGPSEGTGTAARIEKKKSRRKKKKAGEEGRIQPKDDVAAHQPSIQDPPSLASSFAQLNLDQVPLPSVSDTHMLKLIL